MCSYLGPFIGWGLRKDQVLTRAPSFPWAVGPLTITVAVAVLDLKALGLFPTRRAVCMVRILKKKKNKPHHTKYKG